MNTIHSEQSLAVWSVSVPQGPYLYGETRVVSCAMGSIEGAPVSTGLFFFFLFLLEPGITICAFDSVFE